MNCTWSPPWLDLDTQIYYSDERTMESQSQLKIFLDLGHLFPNRKEIRGMATLLLLLTLTKKEEVFILHPCLAIQASSLANLFSLIHTRGSITNDTSAATSRNSFLRN